MNRTTQHMKNPAWTALVAAAALCLALAPAAAAADIAQVRAGSGGLDFQPRVEYGALVLTVSGPDGFHHRAEFGAGESPAFSIFDKAGAVLPDGSYTWELSVVPSDAERREALEANRVEAKRGGVERLVQTGAFAVVAGSVVAGGETEPGARGPGAGNVLAPKATVLATNDGVIRNSLCVGIDCPNSPSFGFDTLRVQENNTRFHFDDTSNTGSFPNNDWRLVANDSANGGRNVFYLEDSTAGREVFSVEAGAPTNSVWVDATAGNVGFGTSTPVLQLHVKDGNTPGLRLEQDGSSGFQAQTWDVAGNEANFFVRSASTGSQLSFRIRPGAPTSSIDIAANGDVGIGTSAPDTELTVKSRATNSDVVKAVRSGATVTDSLFRVFEAPTGEGIFSIFDAANTENIRFTGQAQGRLAIGCASGLGADLTLNAAGGGACGSGTESTINAGATSFTVTSSRSIKQNLEPVETRDILDKIRGIDVYTYDFIEGPADRIGLMAEDFHRIFQRGSEKLLDGQEVDMAMWLAIRELIARNDELASQNEALRRDVEELKNAKE